MPILAGGFLRMWPRYAVEVYPVQMRSHRAPTCCLGRFWKPELLPGSACYEDHHYAARRTYPERVWFPGWTPSTKRSAAASLRRLLVELFP